MRLKSNLLSRFNVIWVVQLYRKKYFAFREPQISSILALSHPSEGRLENVTDAGWDAVDATATQDGRRLKRTAKSCGPDAPTLASSS